MSLPALIEMSLGQAVVETFGVACDDGDPNQRLRVLLDLSDRRLTVKAAGRLMGLGRRQVYRLRRAFAADGPVALVSCRHGRPSNHRHGETFRRTVLTLVGEHYPDFGPTLAVEKLAARHGLRVGVETGRLWMDRRHRLPSPHQPRRRVGHAIAARCRQKRAADRADIGMDDGIASCLVHLAQ